MDKKLTDKIKKMYKEDFMSLNEIGRLLDLHQETVKRRLVKMGVRIRSRSMSMDIHHAKRRKKS